MNRILRVQCARWLGVGLLAVCSTKLWAQEGELEPQPLPPLSVEAQEAADRLADVLAPESEAGLMLASILKGQPMGPNDGWFAIAKPMSRFSWDTLVSQYDSNGNDKIDAGEFPGTDADFKILDRNDDGCISRLDTEWEATRGSSDYRFLASEIDQDANGEVTANELAQWSKQLLSGQASLSAEQLRLKLFPPQPESQERGERGPSRSTLILGLSRQEIGSHHPGPELNQRAPDFQLTTLDGQKVRLSDQIGKRPIVLLFGNYTCGPFRRQAGNIKSLVDKYHDRADFFMVYVREAHPEDGWHMPFNEQRGVSVLQPQTDEERIKVASVCLEHLDLEIPLMVDTIDDQVGQLYSGGPARLYLIDTDGKIAYKGGRGPHFFFPSQLESSLVWLLNAGR